MIPTTSNTTPMTMKMMPPNFNRLAMVVHNNNCKYLSVNFAGPPDRRTYFQNWSWHIFFRSVSNLFLVLHLPGRCRSCFTTVGSPLRKVSLSKISPGRCPRDPVSFLDTINFQFSSRHSFFEEHFQWKKTASRGILIPSSAPVEGWNSMTLVVATVHLWFYAFTLTNLLGSATSTEEDTTHETSMTDPSLTSCLNTDTSMTETSTEPSSDNAFVKIWNFDAIMELVLKSPTVHW